MRDIKRQLDNQAIEDAHCDDCWSHRQKFVAPESGIFVLAPEEECLDCVDMPCHFGCPVVLSSPGT